MPFVERQPRSAHHIECLAVDFFYVQDVVKARIARGRPASDIQRIPLPLTSKYKLGATLFDGDFVRLVKCIDRCDLCILGLLQSCREQDL